MRERERAIHERERGKTRESAIHEREREREPSMRES